MADTVVLTAEPAMPEERKEEGLPPKSFADAVQQGETVNETADTKSDNASESRDETKGTAVGLEEKRIAQDEPIETDGITNGDVNEKKNVQKMELAERSEATTPETNGPEKKDFAGAVRNQAQPSLHRSLLTSSQGCRRRYIQRSVTFQRRDPLRRGIQIERHSGTKPLLIHKQRTTNSFKHRVVPVRICRTVRRYGV